MEEGIEVLGASSDHTIIDVEDAERDYKVGDTMTFDICYATIVYLTNCETSGSSLSEKGKNKGFDRGRRD